MTALLPTTDGSLDPHVVSITFALKRQHEPLLLHSATRQPEQARHISTPGMSWLSVSPFVDDNGCACQHAARTGQDCLALHRTVELLLRRSVFEPSLEPPLRLPANSYSGHTPSLEDFKHAGCHAHAPGTTPAPQDLPALAIDFIHWVSLLSGVTRRTTAVRITSR